MSVLMPGILAGSGGSGGGGIPEAPSDGKTYGRRNAGWAALEGAGSYVHNQGAAAASWTVQHNLGAKPVSLAVFDAAGDLIFGDPDYPGSTVNAITVHFAEPVAGKAYVSAL
jgi:hypothetical protein